MTSTDQIEGFFDPVSYEKGGAVLRMLRSWVNREPSRIGSMPPTEESALAGPKEVRRVCGTLHLCVWWWLDVRKSVSGGWCGGWLVVCWMCVRMCGGFVVCLRACARARACMVAVRC